MSFDIIFPRSNRWASERERAASAMSDTNIYKWAEQSLPNDGAGGSVCIKVVAPIYAFPSSPQFSLAAWAVDIPVLIFAIIVSLISGLELLWSGWNGGLAIFFHLFFLWIFSG